MLRYAMEKFIIVPSPLGPLGIAEEDGFITRVSFGAGESFPQEETPLLRRAAQELDEYFAGRRKMFDLPLRPSGTPFRLKVWRALCRIPYGQTCSYAELARLAGNPKACRAVGGANHHNPVPVIIPCHRVIGADGGLTGYGGGLDKKQFLLSLEQRFK